MQVKPTLEGEMKKFIIGIALIVFAVSLSILWKDDSNRKFRLARGVSAVDLAGVVEGYSVGDSAAGYVQIEVNVSAENISDTFLYLCRQVTTPGFMVFEVAMDESEEAELSAKSNDPYHNDIYYLDDMAFSDFDLIYREYEEFFIHDGLLNVGFGSHNGVDEVLISGYKIFSILATKPEKYIAALNDLGFVESDSLITVWDNFTETAPGHRKSLTVKGRDVDDIVDLLTKRGMYYSEVRVD